MQRPHLENKMRLEKSLADIRQQVQKFDEKLLEKKMDLLEISLFY